MSLPLKGITVIDLTRLVPGPYTTMVLADLGARVIKVESPSAPDILRFPEPYLDGANVGFSTLNRNKESLVVELNRPEGAQVVARLAQDADVLLTSTRPGWLEARGLGYQTLSDRNPKLIVCAMRGYRECSADGQKGGHDINFLALSGLASTIVDLHGHPVLPSVQLGDIAGAVKAALAILAALIARGQSGKGQELEISLTESCKAFTILLEAGALMGMKQETFVGGPLSGHSPAYRYYRCQDDRWIAVGAIESKYQDRVREVLRSQSTGGQIPDEESWPHDLFFGWDSSQAAHRRMEELFASKPRDAWVELFARVDACVTPVLSVAEAAEHAGRSRRALASDGQTVRQPAGALDEAFWDDEVTNRTACHPGLHSEAILYELGYTQSEVEELIHAGIVLTA
jgi:crotonobetainyl-CoA:carnitine CoA-transferase CaiB-like acyl-CoA transferase